MHTNHTTNFELSQFVGTDKPTFLGDYNGDMLKIDTAIAGVGATATGADAKADAAVTAAETASDTASDAATLANTANTNANSALATAGNAATAARAAQTSANAVDTKVGALTDLQTTDKTSIVAAINEVNAKPSVSDAEDVTYDNTTSGLTATNVQTAIDELASGSGGSVDADDVTYDNTTSGLVATNVQAAIDELKALIPIYSAAGLTTPLNNCTINDGGYYVDSNNICHVDIKLTATQALAAGNYLVKGLPQSAVPVPVSGTTPVTAEFDGVYIGQHTANLTSILVGTNSIAQGTAIHFIGSYQILVA